MSRLKLAVLVALGIGAIAWVVSMFVETDEERIEARIEAMTAAAVRRDIDGIVEGLAGGFTYDGVGAGRGPESARSLLQAWIGSGRIVVRSSQVESIEVRGDVATALVFVRVESRDLGGRIWPDRWKVEFERTEEAWLVVSASRQPLGR